MSDPTGRKKSTISRRLASLGAKLRRSPSPLLPTQSASGTQQTVTPLASQSLQVVSAWVPPSTPPSNTNDKSSPIPASAAAQANSGPYTSGSPPISTSTASSLHSSNVEPLGNHYTAIGGISTTVAVPETNVERMKAAGSVIYEGLKTAVQGLYDCSDIFLPLKTASGGLLTIIKIVETVSGNKKELEDLKVKLDTIISIVKKYEQDNGLRALDHRIENFCQAIVLQLKAVEGLQDHSLITRAAEGAKDAEIILKAFRNISSLCDVFQMDTQLNIEETVGDILQRLNSGSINKLYHEMTSYKTRHSSYGDPTGCMAGTRVNILEDLETWASDANSKKVYWMAGMAGTGKSTISHTLCEILEGKNILGGNFFGSRASDNTSNARLIIPVIAHALARASPPIKSKIVKAIDDDPALAEPTYINLNEQFKKLLYNPLRTTAGDAAMISKIVVIDAIDECVNLEVVSSLIRLILQSASGIPLKFFIASRDEGLIHSAFYQDPELSTAFKLHDVEKHLVEDDIRKYIEKSLSDIKSAGSDPTMDAWPTPSELSRLISHSDRLFIYAATSIRYIRDGRGFYKSRLSSMASRDSTTGSKLQTWIIDGLYAHILEQACASSEDSEISHIRQLVSIIVFLRNPLPIQAIVSLSEIENAHLYLSPLSSVIYIPDHTQEHVSVAPFHASFPDFITDPKRCSSENHPSFTALVPSEGHELLALRCLELMNRSLKYNICGVPEESTVSRRGATHALYDINNISAALKYTCVYWASHFGEVQAPSRKLVDALRDFLHKHLLHWIECLSVLGELQTGLKSLQSITTAFSNFRMTDTRRHDLQSLVDDARRCLQRNFDGIQKHCFEIYWSALVWMPKKSLLRDAYAADVRRAPKLILGLSDSWGQTEIVMKHNTCVTSVALSKDASQLVSGSADGIVRIWNTITGEVQAELKGHTDWVRSVAFSQDSNQIVSGSGDKTVRIWDSTTGETQAELKGHRNFVSSVAFSQNGSQVVSGSSDNTVRIWDTTTGKVQAELKGHTHSVTSVAFSKDATQIVSGSADQIVRIWNTLTGEVKAELKGHTQWVTSVAFSQDGSQVASGSNDKTVRIWDTMTGEVQAELKGHTNIVTSVAFSQDGNQVVSGSYDNTVRIWDTTTGKVQAALAGHTDLVSSVAFSQDGSHVVSGSSDKIVRIWDTTKGEAQVELKGHTHSVTSIAFSQDGSQIVSGSNDKTVRIWDTMTGEVQAELKGHTHWVTSVAFSKDGSQVVSGSIDKTVRIWNTMTGKAQAELKGHTDWVICIAFSQDGSQVVSGSSDNTVRIWDTTTGKAQAELKGHTQYVKSVAFSQDGSQVVSGSYDKTVRIWDTMTGEAQAELKGHTDLVTFVAFSQDGSQVVSVSDKTIWIWETKTSEYTVKKVLNSPVPSVLGLEPALSLFDDYWIVGPLYDCWIPSQDRNITSISFWGQRACFGYGSGRVVILDMTAP